MNRFDKPLAAASSISIVIAAVGLVATPARGAGSTTIVLALVAIAIIGGVVLVASAYSYRKWHTHISIVTGLWTERHPLTHKPGRSFESLTSAYPEVAVMRLKSGGTYNLGEINEASSQPLQVCVGDTVIVKRAWGAARGHWYTQIMGVVRADVMRGHPAKTSS